jgi:hypothetical protein
MSQIYRQFSWTPRAYHRARFRGWPSPTSAWDVDDPLTGENKCDLLNHGTWWEIYSTISHMCFFLKASEGLWKKMMWHYIYTYTSYICTPHIFTSYICTSYIWKSYICTSYCVLSAQHTFQHLTSAHLTYHISVFSFSLSLCFSLSRFLSCADWCQAPKRWSKRCRCSCTCIFTVKCAELGQAPKSYKHIHIYIYVCVCLHRSSSHLQSSHLASAHLASSQLTAHIFSCYILHLPSFWWSLLTDLHSVSTIYVF